jgi:very-short-patch-repair endonuclease
VQLPVLDARSRRRRWLDLAWEEAKVGLDYDGEEGHTGRANLRSDRRRHNFLQDQGWAMFYATDLDVYRDFGELMRKVGSAITRRTRRSATDQGLMVAPEDRTTTLSP